MTEAPRQLAAARLPAGQRVALLLIWLVAAVPPALWLAHRSDPELAVRLALDASLWLQRLLIAAIVVFALAALLFPPVPAWLRLRWNDLQLAWASDRGPLLRALSELQHFASAQRHFEVGRLALLRRDFALALPHLQQAVELDPEAPAAHFNLGLTLFRVGRPIQAAPALARAEELDPGHAFGEALLLFGRCLDIAGQHAPAAEVMLRHQERHGGSHRSSYWLGLALAAAGDREAAHAAFARAAAAPTQRLSAVENWFRALARVRTWRGNRR